MCDWFFPHLLPHKIFCCNSKKQVLNCYFSSHITSHVYKYDWIKFPFTSFGNTEIQPVHSEGDQPWDFFGRNDAKAESPVLWPPHAKSWLIGKDSDTGRDWEQEEKGTTKDEMAGWHHWLNGRESEWTQGVGDGQGGLACCDSWGRKESDMTEWLNWTELKFILALGRKKHFLQTTKEASRFHCHCFSEFMLKEDRIWEKNNT